MKNDGVRVVVKRQPIILLLSIFLVSCSSGFPHDRVKNHVDGKECQVDRSWIHEGLSSTLWVQTSAEYAISARATYANAEKALKEILANPNHTAAVEQDLPFANKPPAIIMDVDETVLDNSPFQAQLILDGETYSTSAWNSWVNQSTAQWIPGAKSFIDLATSQGVIVFFVTNRSKSEERATRKNFSGLGYPLPNSPDYLLTKNEQESWTSDKSSRRSFISQNYRVLMLVGDDLNDFIKAPATMKTRQESALKHSNHFGFDWILLPNPSYGSWERVLHQSAEDCEAITQMRRHLTGTNNK